MLTPPAPKRRSRPLRVESNDVLPSDGAEHSGAAVMHLHPVMAVCGVLGLRDQPQTDLSAEEGSDTVENMNNVQRIT